MGKDVKTRAQKKQYSQEEIYRCLNDIKNRTLSIPGAGKMHNIPKSTVFSKLKKKFPVEAKFGSPSILSVCEEELIMKWVFLCFDRRFHIPKYLLLDYARKHIVDQQTVNPF